MSRLHAAAEALLREQEHAEVQAVLAAFTRSPLMARLFSYVCQKYFDDASEHLSEVKIAIEVFGRTADFDRNYDAIARVEAHRLRKKLKSYYETEGKSHPIRIELPAGSYVPVFRRVPVETSASAPVGENAISILKPSAPALLGARLPLLQQEPSRPRKRFRWWYLAVAVTFALSCSPFRGV